MLSSIARINEQTPLESSRGAALPCLGSSSFWPHLHIVDSAWLEHGPFAFWLTEAVRPRTFVELGTHNGFSYLSFCQATQWLGLSTTCYAVDTWTGDAQAGFYGEAVYEKFAALNDQHYSGFSQLLRCRFEEALPYFDDGEIDLLHIDGRHTYEDVRADFERWREKLSSRGVAVFHDTNVRRNGFGVWRFWSEVAQCYPAFEFHHGHGLGVLAVGPDVPAGLRKLLEADADETHAIRAAYARLGHDLSRQYLLAQAHGRLGEAAAMQDRLHSEQRDIAADRDTLRAERAAVIAERDGLLGALEDAAVECRRMRAETAATVSERDHLRRKLEDTAADQARLRSERDELRSEMRDTEATLDSLRAAYRDMPADLSRMSSVHQAATADGDVPHGERQRMIVEGDCLRREPGSLNHAVESTKAAVLRMQAKVESIEKANLTLCAQLVERQQDLQALRGKAERQARFFEDLGTTIRLQQQSEQALRVRISHFEQSTIWRATSPLRVALRRTPPSMRLALRRGVKALWWTVTPHRTGTRIAFLRARRRQRLAMRLSTDADPHPIAAFATAHAPQRLGRSVLAFSPAPRPGNVKRSADRDGRYNLVEQSDGYVYVPARRPDHLDRILADLSRRVQFSIVVPVFNTAPDLLSRMLTSVYAQWYPDWQLILADDASTTLETRDFLAGIDYARVTVLWLGKNGGISAATNAALSRASGEYVVFLDHDDELTADCLFELALCIARDDPDFIYSDEDKINQEGQFTQPFFKPDWSPDTLMSTMYTSHVSCVRRRLLDEVGPLRSEFDGSQDWDLTLRCTERTRRIVHIPKVLYHWRIIPSSVAADLAAKPYAVHAGRRARQAALERRGVTGVMEAVEQECGYFRVRYQPRGTPLVSILIPTRDNGRVLRRCVDSIRGISSWRTFEVLIIDNGSTNSGTLKTIQDIEKTDGVAVIRHGRPFNFSQLNNIGARQARGDCLLFLNDDTEMLSADALERMAGYAQQAHVGAVGAKLIYPGTLEVQHAGIVNLASGPNHAFLRESADAPGYFMRNLLEYDWAAVTGACLMVERAKFEAVGGFNEEFPLAYNDVDLCFRLLKQGLFNVVCPTARWLHHESFSRGSDVNTPDRLARLMTDLRRLYLRHPDMLMRDPFYNPNLHPNSVHFEVPA